MKSVVITGVSTGIGLATAKRLCLSGWTVFGSVRRKSDAETCQAEITGNFHPLIFDVTDAKAIQAAADKVCDVLNGKTLNGLINNAGIAVPGPILHLTADQLRHQLDVNLVSIHNVTNCFAGLLGVDANRTGTPGRIVNMSSISGKRAMPFMSAYTASKHALEGFSAALRRELMIYGIDVIVIGPGTIATPIWDKAEAIDRSQYQQTDYAEAIEAMAELAITNGRNGLPADAVAKCIEKALTAQKPRTRYAVLPPGIWDRIFEFLPDRFADYLIARKLRLSRR